jgi:hypothetical protein
MAVETLKIVLTADNKQAIAGMNETVTSLNKVSTAGAATGGAVTKMGTGFNGLSKVLGNIPSGLTNVSGGLSGLAGQATGVEMAFGGIGLALGIAMVAFEAFNNATTITNDWWKEANKNIAEFDVKIINATNSISAAREGVISKEDALKKYNDSLGSTVGYAKSLDEAESLMAKNAATVSQAIMLKTQAQILYQKSAALSASVITGEAAQLSLLQKATIVAKSAFGGLSEVVINTASEMGDNFASATAEAKKLKEQGDALTKQSLDLQKTLAGSTTKPGEGDGKGNTEESKEKKALAEMIKAREAYFAEIERMAADAEMKKDQRRIREMKGEFNTIMPEKSNAQQKDLTNLKLTMDGNTALNQVKQQQIAIDDQLNARTELATKLTDRAMQGLAGVANAMANGGNIGEAFGNMFKQLAIDIALAAAKAAIFQAILSAINPVGGASKAGGFLKGFGKLLGFAQGGTVSGPQSGYPVMLHGTEHIVRPDQMKSIIASAAQMGGGGASKVVVEGRIRGNDIFLSQQRTGTFRSLTT